MTERKTCSCCKQDKKLERFPKDRAVCKECWAGKQRNNYECAKNSKISQLLRWAVPFIIVTAVYSHDFVKGSTRTCVYESIYGYHAMSINTLKMCPMTMEFEV